MRNVLRRIFDEDWIVILGSGIGLGYVVLNLAEAVGNVFVTALAIVLGPIVQSLVAPVVVLAAVAFAGSRLKAPPSDARSS